MAKRVQPKITIHVVAIVFVIACLVVSFLFYGIIPKADVNPQTGCLSNVAVAFDTANNNNGGSYTYNQAFSDGLTGAAQGTVALFDYFDRINATIPSSAVKAEFAFGAFPTEQGTQNLTNNSTNIRYALNHLFLNLDSDLQPGLVQAWAQLQQGLVTLPAAKRVIILISPALDNKNTLYDTYDAANTANQIRADNITLVGIQLGTVGYMSSVIVPTSTAAFGQTLYQANNKNELAAALVSIGQKICNDTGGTSVPPPTVTPGTVSLITTQLKQRLRPGDTVNVRYDYANNTNQIISNVIINQSLPTGLTRIDGAAPFSIGVGSLSPGQQGSTTVTLKRN